MDPNAYATIKALHIIFMVSWFAGLFYIVRLFIYHTEAQQKSDLEKKVLSEQFIVMEKKLWWIITTPAMLLTIIFGVIMLYYNAALLSMPWMQVKLGFVGMLLLYHFVCQKIMFDLQLQRFHWTSNGLRVWNEVATLGLVAIIFLVEMQSGLNWIKATVGFFLVAVMLMLGIKLYKRLRTRK
jgi:putative membrane protein